jgi:hypothetical protein
MSASIPLRPEPTAEQAEAAVVELFAVLYSRTVEEMRRKFGEEAYDIARRAFLDSMLEGWIKAYDALPDRTLKTYVDWLTSIVTAGTRYEIVEKGESSIRLKFSVCPWATYFRKIGKPEIGRFFCDADQPMVEAFNESIGFEIHKTLMKGDEYCDHHFFVKGKETAGSR